MKQESSIFVRGYTAPGLGGMTFCNEWSKCSLIGFLSARSVYRRTTSLRLVGLGIGYFAFCRIDPGTLRHKWRLHRHGHHGSRLLQ
jgi:hypothetical protein